MNLKSKKFYSDNITIGSWISLYNLGMTEIFAKNNFDWIVVDLEHSHITINQAAELIRIIDLCGSRPLVRLTSNNQDQIKRVLDAGADGVIVPMIRNKEEAKQAVDYVKYPPIGKRGVGLNRAQKYGTAFDTYQEWVKDEVVVIAQIEHIDAVNNLEDIFSVPGIDGIIVGPYDLSSSLGKPGDFNSKQYLDSLKKIKHLINSKKIIAGIHIVEPDIEKVNDAIKDGFNFVSYSVDFRIIDSTIKDAIQSLQKTK